MVKKVKKFSFLGYLSFTNLYLVTLYYAISFHLPLPMPLHSIPVKALDIVGVDPT
jgi:hypothetical protein